MNLAWRNGAVPVRVAETSANFHRLLGMTPVVGRTFSPDEDKPGHTNLAVISYSLWQQLFGGDFGVTGSSIQLNGVLLTVIGVAPPQFDYPGTTSVWIPTVFDSERVPKLGAFVFQTMGRLKSDVNIQQAGRVYESEIQRNAPGFLHPDDPNPSRLLSIREELSGPVGKAAWVLAGMSLFVLLAACANVAHLLLSRIAERRDEISMRAALGASPARVMQQLTTEALVLTGAAAALGLIVAIYISKIASGVAPPVLAIQQYTILDWRVVAFAGALAVLTGILFGVFPSFLAGHMRSQTQTMRAQPGSPGTTTARVRFTLLALQACVTIVLLSTSVTMGRTFLQLLATDLGFRPENAVTMSVSLQGTKHRSGAAQWRYYSDVLERLRGLLGVEAAGAVGHLPLANNVYMVNAVKLDSGQVIGEVVTNGATAGYFRAMGTKFLAGRDFQPAIRAGSEPVVIVNEAFARVAGLGTHVVGRRITASWTKTPYLIAGVVETSRSSGPARPGVPMIYWPVEEEPSSALTFVARVHGDANAYLAKCRDAVKTVDPGVPIYGVSTLEQRRANVLARPRMLTTTTLLLSLLALFLAIVGTFGVAAQTVVQRSREIGIRVALGGSHARIRAMLLHESLAPTVAGAAMGIAIAIAGDRYVKHLVDNVPGIGTWAWAAAGALLTLSAFVAAWRASARLLRIHPSDAVRVQ
jgi:predicted permease